MEEEDIYRVIPNTVNKQSCGYGLILYSTDKILENLYTDSFYIWYNNFQLHINSAVPEKFIKENFAMAHFLKLSFLLHSAYQILFYIYIFILAIPIKDNKLIFINIFAVILQTVLIFLYFIKNHSSYVYRLFLSVFLLLYALLLSTYKIHSKVEIFFTVHLILCFLFLLSFYLKSIKNLYSVDEKNYISGSVRPISVIFLMVVYIIGILIFVADSVNLLFSSTDPSGIYFNVFLMIPFVAAFRISLKRTPKDYKKQFFISPLIIFVGFILMMFGFMDERMPFPYYAFTLYSPILFFMYIYGLNSKNTKLYYGDEAVKNKF